MRGQRWRALAAPLLRASRVLRLAAWRDRPMRWTWNAGRARRARLRSEGAAGAVRGLVHALQSGQEAAGRSCGSAGARVGATRAVSAARDAVVASGRTLALRPRCDAGRMDRLLRAGSHSACGCGDTEWEFAHRAHLEPSCACSVRAQVSAFLSSNGSTHEAVRVWRVAIRWRHSPRSVHDHVAWERHGLRCSLDHGAEL